MPKLEEVFGVSSKPVLSYIERPDVDNKFKDALTSDKQIIVYGASKQGKTALVTKHIPVEDNITVSLTPRTSVVDIYKSILGKAGIRLQTATRVPQAPAILRHVCSRTRRSCATARR